jgi:hypothetical protein
MVLDEIDAALSLWDRLKKWRHAKKNPPVESVAARFVCLFESHGVHRNQIPRFFGHSLTLEDVQDETSLVAKLDETILEAVCTRFAVRREWLDGAELQVHHCHDFYKHPETFALFIDGLKINNPDGDLHGVLIAPNQPDWQACALLILQEVIGSVGDKPIYRYHLCNNWVFSYWKARAYLTACVAIARKQKVYVHGIRMSNKEIERLAEGKTLLGWQGEGIWKLGNKSWNAEDMALKPEIFLNGVEPERDNFGIKAGLGLWLDLEQQGLMDTGSPEVNARKLFQQERAKYSLVAIDGVA